MTGCSGDDDDDKAATPTSAPAPTTTVRPVDTSFTGQGSAQFCGLARTYNQRFTSVGANPSPAQLRTLATEGQAAISEAVTAAPAEIKRDVEVIANSFKAFLGELEKVNFEVARVPPTALQSLSAPEFQQASTRFQAYTRSVCGVGG